MEKAPDGRCRSLIHRCEELLSDTELSQLNLITTAFLDTAESRAQRHIVSTMDDWKKFLQQYLATMGYEQCDTAGKVSQEEARDKAYSEYEKYKLIQDQSYISDFDRFNEGNEGNSLLPFDLNPSK